MKNIDQSNNKDFEDLEKSQSSFFKEFEEDKVSSKNPVILLFYLSEFEETCGKLEMEISNKIYNCPFFIYDISFDKLDLTFENEEEIDEAETQLGFDILDKIWLDYFVQAPKALIDALFIKIDVTEEGYSLLPKLGFLPGYDLEASEETAKGQNFNVIRWKSYWS